MQKPASNDEFREITYAEFVKSDLDSLTWHDLLPGDKVTITSVPDAPVAEKIGELLLEPENTANQGFIDHLAAKIINNSFSNASSRLWQDLAAKLSAIMAANLHAKGDRPLRMRAQRLNYYLQALIDKNAPAGDNDLVLSETVLDGSKPWDYIRHENVEWWLSSDSKKIRYRETGGQPQFSNFGLPTQIDLQPGGVLSFGSLYTDGATLWDHGEWQHIEHEIPVVLVFEHDGQRFLLDHRGRIWKDQPRRLLFESPRPQVHFARYFEARVFLLDNSDFGHITVIDMESGLVNRQSVLPVQVCNDITATDQAYYLVDKQQGSVFKFDTEWNYLARALTFGRGRAALLDPVALRCQDDRLFVVSWLNARLTELKLF